MPDLDEKTQRQITSPAKWEELLHIFGSYLYSNLQEFLLAQYSSALFKTSPNVFF